MLEIRGTGVWYGSNGTALNAFPELLEAHLRHTENTVELEAIARKMITDGLPPEDLTRLIRGVCRWGGYPGIAGRILKNNAPTFLVECFSTAHRELLAETPGPERAGAALRVLNKIKGLGTPSFASKHLRFLAPEICPVLDRFIAHTCGYAFTPARYERYARDCAAVAAALDAAGVRNPFPSGSDGWRAADVDAAIFARIRIWG